MFKKLIGGFSVFTLIASISLVGAATSDDTELQIVVNDGVLAIEIVDAAGTGVASPQVDFGSITTDFSDQTISGTLGVSAERIRASNPTGTATWTVSMAATSGITTTWSDGSDTFDFNDEAGTEALEVQPSGASIADVHGGGTTNVSVGSNDHFDQGATDSITLMSAAAGAPTYEEFDLTGVTLIQDIPALQPAGTYTIDMTVSIV